MRVINVKWGHTRPLEFANAQKLMIMCPHLNDQDLSFWELNQC